MTLVGNSSCLLVGTMPRLSQKIVIDIFYAFYWLSLPLGDRLAEDKNK